MQAGEVVSGRFRIDQRAGSGGMGSVYRATDQHTGETVALKLLHPGVPDGELRFAREAAALARMSHPSVVRYIAHGTSGKTPFVAMEWLEGEDLGKRLRRQGLTLAETVALGRRVAEALGHAHALGIVHRDVKPANLFFRDADLTKLCVVDFGLARLTGDESGFHTAVGTMLGTPGYMAPEQARGTVDMDARVDVFALGCVLYKCLTGQGPFAGPDAVATLAKVLFDEPPRLGKVLPGAPPDLEGLLAQMLDKTPGARPRDGADVADRLARTDITYAPSVRIPAEPSQAVLTTREKRLVSVVVAARGRFGDEERTMLRNAESLFLEREGALREAAAVFDARIEILAGAVVATVHGQGSATDQAARAARLGLAFRHLLPGVPVALATGRAELGERAMGDVIDRAVRRVSADPEDATEVFSEDGRSGARIRIEAAKPRTDTVWLDEVTAGLLGAEFSVEGGVAGLELTGEHAAAEVQVRTLLGKPTPCVGRERELAQLDALLAQVVSDPVARAILVTAPAGVGKSRVRYEWLERVAASDPPVQIWSCRADPMGAGSPFAMLAQLLREAASIDPSEPAETSRARLRARLSRHVPQDEVPGVADFLGEMIGVRFPDDDRVQLRAARQDPMLMGDQMRRAWEAWLLAECDEGRPLLIVLEDLHWGDLPTVRFVDFALRALADRPLMVLALARPEISDLFPELWQGRKDELHLHELSAKAGAKLARHVLGPDVPEEQIQRIVTRAAGNAFFLEEIVRAVAEGRGDDDVPETVLAMVQRRIEGFEPDARRVLRAASVFGDTFWRGSAISLLGGATNPVTQVADWLTKLVEREVIGRRSTTRFTGEDEFVFRHAIVRDAAYGMLTDEDRPLGHRLAAEWLERHGERDAAALAEHFERGTQLERAIPHYQRATAQALDANELGVVITRADCGVRCGARGEVLGDLRRMQAEAMRWRGLIAEAEAGGKEALALLPAGSAAWFSALGELSTAAGGLAHVDVLLSVRDKLQEARPSGFNAGYAVALCRTAGQLYAAGQRAFADAMIADAENLDRREAARYPIVFARLEQARGYRALYSSDQGTYYELTKISRQLFESAGDRRNACLSAVNMGYVAITVGAYEAAEEELVPALKVSELLGITRIRAIFMQNLGLLRHLQGRQAESIALQRPAIEVFATQGDRRLGAFSHYYLSMALDAEGSTDEALEEARAAVRVAEPLPPTYASTLGGLADLELRHGLPKQQALAHAEEAFRILEKLGGLEDTESRVRLSYAEALVAVGRRDEAAVTLRAACDGIMERASKITNAGWRESFLRRIPEHTKTFALARELGVAIS